MNNLEYFKFVINGRIRQLEADVADMARRRQERRYVGAHFEQQTKVRLVENLYYLKLLTIPSAQVNFDMSKMVQ